MTRVLVVDDEPLIRTFIRDLLEQEGYTVSEAADGKQGQSAFSSADYDLVITDVLMPQIDGVEFIQGLRNRGSDVPILAISGGGYVGGDLCLKLAMSLGARATLAKPFGREDLVNAVSSCLSTNRPRSSKA